jgi:hypothetical protein
LDPAVATDRSRGPPVTATAWTSGSLPGGRGYNFPDKGFVMHRNVGPLDRPVAWFVVALLAEVAIFYAHVQIQIAPYYPQVFDQLNYIGVAQDILRDVHVRGFAALTQPFLSPAPTGITYPEQGALVALVFGYSRASLLTVNLIYFLAAQIAIFFTMMRSRNDAAAAWLSISIFVACDSIFRRAGGIADYRIDFAAMCLFGVWVCLLAKTDQFSSRRFSIFAGAAAAALILMRFITAAFVGPIMMALLGWLVFRRRSMEDWRRRAINYSISGAIIAIVIAPALVAALGLINNYYVAGHIKGDEPAIRAAEFGISDLSGHLMFYPRALLDYQIGSTAGVLIVIALVAAAAGFARRTANRPRVLFEAFLTAMATILPMIVLTLDVSKSPVVAGVVMIPSLLLVMFCWRSSVVPAFSKSALQLAACFYIVVGFAAFIAHASSPNSEFSAAELAEVKRLNLVIATHGGAAPRLAFDRLTDYLNAFTVRFYFREMNGWSEKSEPRYVQALGGIFAVNRADAVRTVQDSDIVVLSDETLKRSQSPFDQSIVRSWRMIDDYAQNNLKLLATGKIDDITYRIFERPAG